MVKNGFSNEFYVADILLRIW